MTVNEKTIQTQAEMVIENMQVPYSRDIGERMPGIWAAVSKRKNLETKQMQEWKMEALGRFGGDIAREFNDLLTVIYSFTNIVEIKTGSDSSFGPYLNRVTQATERATALARSLQTFSGKGEMCLRELDLDKAIARAGALMTRMMREDISLTILRSQFPLFVMADESRLIQVLLNLAENSRDAMPRGGSINVIVSPFVIDRNYVESHGYGKTGNYALITFWDSGCGMDTKTQERIFEPFFTTKETGKGAGLGLAIVCGIVKQMKGFIEVCSSPGAGTVMKIYLPMIEETPVQGDANIQDATTQGGNETVLLAEDDPMVRGLVEMILMEAGYTVISVNDGAEAIETFRERGRSTDLLVIDAVMPKKNGLKVLRETMEMKPDVSIVMMSDYAPEVMAMNDFIRQGVRIIQKPVCPQEFLAAVREVLDRRA